MSIILGLIEEVVEETVIFMEDIMGFIKFLILFSEKIGIIDFFKEIMIILKEIGVINFFKWIMGLFWRIPDLEIITLLVLGLVVEKRYIGRVGVFTNFMAVLIFFNERGIKTDWIFLYLGIGFILSVLLGMPTYIATIWSENKYSLPKSYYYIAYLFYGSFTVALIMKYYGGIGLEDTALHIIIILGFFKFICILINDNQSKKTQ